MEGNGKQDIALSAQFIHRQSELGKKNGRFRARNAFSNPRERLTTIRPSFAYGGVWVFSGNVEIRAIAYIRNARRSRKQAGRKGYARAAWQLPTEIRDERRETREEGRGREEESGIMRAVYHATSELLWQNLPAYLHSPAANADRN